MANKYFTPLDAFGTQGFQQAGEPAGWYQFLVDVPVVPTIPIVLRDIAQGVLIQAISEVRYCLSPAAAAAGTTAYLVLPAGTTLFLSGAQAMRQFCILLPAAGAEFVVQIYTGNIGPIPLIHQPGTVVPPGPPPPPPPGGAVVPTSNTLHVMAAPWGNDATGTRERLDLPFLTCAAAEAAASNGDTIMVWQGTFTESALGTKRLFYVLQGSVIEGSGASVFDIKEDINISGPGLIQGTGGATTAIIIASGRTLNIDGADIQSAAVGISLQIGSAVINGNIRSTGNAIECNDSPVNITMRGNITSQDGTGIADIAGITGSLVGNITSNSASSSNHAISCGAGGLLNIYGNVTSNAGIGIENYDAATINVRGTVTSFAGQGVQNSAGGTVTINGDVWAATTGARNQGGGRLNITGNVYTPGISIQGDGGEINFTGNAISDNSDAMRLENTVANITGNLTGGNSTVGTGRALGATDSTVKFVGNAYGLAANHAIQMDGGSIFHDGIASMLINAAAVYITNSVVAELHGTYYGGTTSGGVRLFNCTAGTLVNIYGKLTGGFSGLFVQGSDDAIVHLYAETIGNSSNGSITLQGGQVYVHSIARSTVSGPAIRISGVTSLLTLMGGCRVERTGAGNSIASFSPGGQALTIKSYVASANTAVEGTLTVNGVLNIIV